MRRGHLLDSQVRELKEAVLASGLGEQFDWEERDGDWAGYVSSVGLPTLVFKPDNFFFAFEYHEAISDPMGMYNDPGGHQVFFAPGRESPNEVRRGLNWNQVLGAFRAWLRFIAREKGITPPPTPPGPGASKRAPPPAAKPLEAPKARLGAEHKPFLGYRVNRWLKNESERRGPLWKVLAWVIPLAVGVAIALLS